MADAKKTKAVKKRVEKKAPKKTTKKVSAGSKGGSLRLKEHYRLTVLPGLREKFKYPNRFQIPALRKIVLNVGMGAAIQNSKLLDAAVKELALITGQSPIITKAKKSIAGFKVREGMPIGCCVTLRGNRMYEFLDRLNSIALPRIRDFRGISRKSFDGNGNYTMGLKEQLVFPEIKYDEIAAPHGMDITIVTTAKSNDEALALLESLGMPFKAA